MTFGELEASQVLLGNCILILPQVFFLVLKSYFEMSITMSAVCLMGLCVIFCWIVRIEACNLSW